MNAQLIRLIFAIALCLVIANTSFAHYEALYTPEGSELLDLQKPTSILMVGLGKALANLPFEAAYLKAQKIHALYPERQIVFFRPDDLHATGSFAMLKKTLKVYFHSSKHLNNQKIVERLLNFAQIAELHYFGHSNPWHLNYDKGEKENNFGLENSEKRTPFASNFEELKDHFTKDAFVSLNGCNAGFYLAPYLSQIWNLPVSAAMSGSNFQKLHTDGEFYTQEEGKMPALPHLRSFKVLQGKAVRCMEGKGSCTRMRPADLHYGGYWGFFQTHLPFYKTFCNFDDVEKCFRGLALSMISNPTITPLDLKSSREEYESAVLEFLCPNYKNRSDTLKCRRNLKLAAFQKRTFNPLPKEVQIQCDLKGCNFQKILCLWGQNTGRAIGHSCRIIFDRDANSDSSTIVDEYDLYMQAFKYL
ncbi:MAG: hypothetical protein A2X86_14690 [Bdellovibrionales bacterium GWA2_49_15]|nr:MAG: hypothetical protein A2X86_14690 [Bdellovibrionales bacterium GWA2_49_15]HAZ13412.1 hypothetical protein [Bdellovibrionales bacterium]